MQQGASTAMIAVVKLLSTIDKLQLMMFTACLIVNTACISIANKLHNNISNLQLKSAPCVHILLSFSSFRRKINQTTFNSSLVHLPGATGKIFDNQLKCMELQKKNKQ
jgi:hypothetical protein